MYRIAAARSFLLRLPPPAADDSWPSFRGPTGDGQDPGRPWRACHLEREDNIVWKTPIHDKGWSSPVVWGKQIWMTTARDDGKELWAVCVDREAARSFMTSSCSTSRSQHRCPIQRIATPRQRRWSRRAGFTSISASPAPPAWTRQRPRFCGRGAIWLAITGAGRAPRRSCTKTCSSSPLTATISSTWLP